MDVRVENVWAAGHMGCTFQLDKLCRKLSNVKYGPGHPGAYIQLRVPRCTFKIHRGGKCVLFGVGSVDQVHLAFVNLQIKLEREGKCREIKVRDVRVTNIMGVGKVDGVPLGVSLDKIMTKYGHLPHLFFEAEMFPPIKYRLGDKGAFLNLFQSGRFVFRKENL